MNSEEHKGVLTSPYGGNLVDLRVKEDERDELLEKSSRLPSVQISMRSLCDLELLATGAFSPLDRFMGKADYERVLTEMRLENGVLFPIPITLPIDEDSLPSWGEQVTLSDARNNTIAVMQIEEIYHWDPQREARLVLGSTDPKHPLISEMVRWGKVYVSGEWYVLRDSSYVDLPGVSFFLIERHPDSRELGRMVTGFLLPIGIGMASDGENILLGNRVHTNWTPPKK